MCSYGQLSEVQMLLDLDVDLESSQGHINIYSTCRTTSLPNYVTVASCTTEIWPFEFREILTFGEVWTLVIAFLEENSKIGLRQAVVQDSSHAIITNHQFWAPRKHGGGDRARKVQFSQLRKLRDLDLDLRSGRGHTVVEVYPQTKLGRDRKKTFCGRTDGGTDGRTDTPEFQSTRSDLIKWKKN